jgi:hypothetical protein
MPIPKVNGALRGWLKTYTLSRISKAVVNHLPVELFEDYSVKMNIQPMPAEKVNRKPEEQRAWIWYSIWMNKNIELNIDDIVIIKSKQYKIQSKTRWDDAGYYSFDATEDFEE